MTPYARSPSVFHTHSFLRDQCPGDDITAATGPVPQWKFPKVLPFQMTGTITPPEIVLLEVDEDWETTNDIVSEYYGLSPWGITFTVDITLSNGSYAETTITRSSWKACVEQLTSGSGPRLRVIKVSGVIDPETKLDLYIETTTRDIVEVDVYQTSTVRGLMFKIHDKEGIPLDQMALYYKGRQLRESAPLVHYEIRTGSLIELRRLSWYRNWPPICLYPPVSYQRQGQALPTPRVFHSVYPVTRRVTPTGLSWEYVEWNVHAKPNGELECFRTGVEVPSLCWDAKTNTTATTTSSTATDEMKPAFTNGDFNPTHPCLTPLDPTAVVLETTKFRQYLEPELETLGLNSTQSQDFISHWLPAIYKHTHIALRFLPQAAYNSAAPLEITPKPACITRVFMLFRGVKEKDLPGWGKAKELAHAKPSADVVGVDKARIHDEKVFRVLEWGGMEVF